jgi:hypothetical protein
MQRCSSSSSLSSRAPPPPPPPPQPASFESAQKPPSVLSAVDSPELIRGSFFAAGLEGERFPPPLLQPPKSGTTFLDTALFDISMFFFERPRVSMPGEPKLVPPSAFLIAPVRWLSARTPAFSPRGAAATTSSAVEPAASKAVTV